MLYYSCLCCLLFSLISCEQYLDCVNKANAKTTAMRLKLDLLCGYDKYLRPVIHHTNRTTVSIIIAPRIIDFDDSHSMLRIKIWLSMNWLDTHLSWDKLKYDDMDQFNLDTTMVWVPDLSVYNGKEDLSLDQVLAPAIVDYQGNVYTFMSPELAGHCVPDWANWPFDLHVCTITLGSKRFLGSTVDFHFVNDKKEGLSMRYLLPNKDWELVNTNSTRNETQLGPKNETDGMFLVSLNYEFTLRRHATVYVASYLVPGIVFIILSLGVLWIPSDHVERVAIVCSLVILQSLFLQYLAYKIPANGDKTPYIVCFYRDSLLLTGFLVVETLVTRSMCTWNSSPTYLQNTFKLVAHNRVLQVLFTTDMDPKKAALLMEAGGEEGSTLVPADEGTSQWRIFVNIINKFFFIILIPVYLLLSVSLLPYKY